MVFLGGEHFPTCGSLFAFHDALTRQIDGVQAARALLKRGGRITFPPALGEPDLVADLPELVGNAEAELLLPYRTRRAPLEGFGPSVKVRALFGSSRIDPLGYAPILYGRLPGLIARGGLLEVDVALVRVSPPDANGLHNVGPSASISGDLIRSARAVIAEIDPDLPRTRGDTLVPGSLLTVKVDARRPLELPSDEGPMSSSGTAEALGDNLASLVQDGAVLQIGIGSALHGCIHGLRRLRGLRVVSGLLSNSIQDLLESDAVDAAWAPVVGEAIGPASLMKFIDRNEKLRFESGRVIHNPLKLARFEKLVTINSAIQVDLLGRIACEGFSNRLVAGVGGLIDFLMGGHLAPGGCNVIALPSLSSSGQSRIVARLPSEQVSVPPYLIDYIVTEWGVADMRVATRKEAASRLTEIAHPNSRASLSAEFAELAAATSRSSQ